MQTRLGAARRKKNGLYFPDPKKKWNPCLPPSVDSYEKRQAVNLTAVLLAALEERKNQVIILKGAIQVGVGVPSESATSEKSLTAILTKEKIRSSSLRAQVRLVLVFPLKVRQVTKVLPQSPRDS